MNEYIAVKNKTIAILIVVLVLIVIASSVGIIKGINLFSPYKNHEWL